MIVKESAAVTAPWRWREKEVEMQSLQGRLTEREREIGRLKEKLRDLTKKLRQEQQLYNSKVCTMHEPKTFHICNNKIGILQESLQQQQNGAEWNVLSQGSRELEGLLKLVSKERLQLERHFVLATQVYLQDRFSSFFPVGLRTIIGTGQHLHINPAAAVASLFTQLRRINLKGGKRG